MNEKRVETIREKLLDALEPELLEIEDESHLHAGHAGARDGRGHFRLTIVSKPLPARRELAGIGWFMAPWGR
jgi:BolA family transcriptional regulator, general stress-responsive regulator